MTLFIWIWKFPFILQNLFHTVGILVLLGSGLEIGLICQCSSAAAVTMTMTAETLTFPYQPSRNSSSPLQPHLEHFNSSFSSKTRAKPHHQTRTVPSTENVLKVFHTGEIGKHLTCSASPNQHVQWIRIFDDGMRQKLGPQVGFSIGFSRNRTILTFPSITKDLEGIYVCQVQVRMTREFGATHQKPISSQFHVQISQVSPDTNFDTERSSSFAPWSGLAVIFLVVLSTSLCRQKKQVGSNDQEELLQVAEAEEEAVNEDEDEDDATDVDANVSIVADDKS